MNGEQIHKGTGVLLDRLLSKFREPWFIFLCFVTTWVMIAVVTHSVDIKLEVMQEFINDKLVYPPMLVSYDPTNSNIQSFNISAKPSP